MHQEIDSLLTAVEFVIKNEIDVDKKVFNLNSFKDKRAEYYGRILAKQIILLRDMEFGSYATQFNLDKIERIKKAIDTSVQAYKARNFSLLKKELLLLKSMQIRNIAQKQQFKLPNLPIEIRSEVTADAQELEKCFEQGLYRSSIILSGRILETCLHRKYFDLTQKDILETSPGIGLGNLIAKLRETNYSFSPGLSEQIHLINQVRIYSVHKKQEAFIPSKEQAQAIMLFTLDVVNKLF